MPAAGLHEKACVCVVSHREDEAVLLAGAGMLADLASLGQKCWFPAGSTAITDFESLDEGAPELRILPQLPPGFTGHEVSLPWTTLTMLLPPVSIETNGTDTSAGIDTAGIEEPEWWSQFAAAAETWGDVGPMSAVGKVRIRDGRSGPVAHLDCGRHGLWMAEFIPFDTDGHARRLADFSSERCHVARGGVQWNGRDVILLRRDLSALPNAADALREALVDGDTDRALALVRNAGALLGRFHKAASKVVRKPRDAGRWNDRLKRIEEVTKAKTLWRAPHATATDSTITHRSFSLECVLLLRDADGAPDCGRGRLFLGAPGLQEALLPLEGRMPALRDVAAGYRSIEIARRAAEKTVGCQPLPNHGELRGEFLEGWASRAPKAWSSDSALDSHRGGVPIWEYEAVLIELLTAFANGEEPNSGTNWFIDHVDRIQAQMFRSRTFAAAALATLCCSGFGVYAWLTGMMVGMEALPFVLVGLLNPPLRRLYRLAAPPAA